MKVQSTGLGKTVMVAEFKAISSGRFAGEQVMQVTMEAHEPLHWKIRVHLEPGDVRRALLLGLRPSVIWRLLLAVVFGRFSIFSRAGSATEVEPSDTEAILYGPSEGLGPDSEEEPVNPLASLKG